MVLYNVHWLSGILLTCPADVSWYVMHSILLFKFVCAAASLCFASVVSAHVSAPYVIAGSIHDL